MVKRKTGIPILELKAFQHEHLSFINLIWLDSLYKVEYIIKGNYQRFEKVKEEVKIYS